MFHANLQMYEQLKVAKSQNAHSAFLSLAESFSKTEALDLIFYAEDNIDETQVEGEAYAIAIIDTDLEGKIIKGMQWVDSDKPYYEQYQDGQIIRKGEVDVLTFQKMLTEFYESFTTVR